MFQRFIRPVLAFLGACALVGTVILLALLATDTSGSSSEAELLSVVFGLLAISLVAGTYTAAVTAIPALVGVWLVRQTQLPRGITDTVVAGLLGFGVLLVMNEGSLPGQGAETLLALIIWAGGGALGGYTYWRLAGRPQSPYD